MTIALKIAGLLLMAATKFLLAPGLVRLAGFNFWQCIVILHVGGYSGIFAFYYLGKLINQKIDNFFSKKKKKKFTKFNRFVIKGKNIFGLTGVALVTPCIISIPIGCAIASKYFKHNPSTLTYLLLSLSFWAFVLSVLVYMFEFKIG